MKNTLSILFVAALLTSVSFASAIISPNTNNKSSVITGTANKSNIIESNKNTSSQINTINNSYNSYIKELERVYNETNNINDGIKLFNAYLSDSNKSANKYVNATICLHKLSSAFNEQNLTIEQKEFLTDLENKLRAKYNEAPNNAATLSLLSGLSAIQNKYNDVLPYAEKAYKQNPREYAHVLGYVYLNMQKFPEAKKVLNEAIKYNPRDYDCYAYLLSIYTLLKEQDKVADTAKYLISQRKEVDYAIKALFYANDMLNRPDSDFINIVAGVTHQNIQTPEKIYSYLAARYINKSDFEIANNFKDKAIQINPNDPNIYLDIADAYIKIGNSNEAKNLLSQAQRLINTKDEISKYNLISAQINGDKIVGAKELMESGLYEDAIKVYENSSNPNSLEALLGIATSLQYLGNKEKALVYYNKAMSMYPDNADVYYAFAFYFTNNNDVETARKYLNNALRLNPKHKDALKLANHIQMQKEDDLLELAFAHFDSRNYPEAIDTLNKIIEISPSNVAAYYYKGLTYVSMGNYNSAINEFLKVIRLAPEYSLAYYSLGIAYDNINEPTEAVKYYKKYINIASPQTAEEQSYFDYATSRINKLTSK